VVSISPSENIVHYIHLLHDFLSSAYAQLTVTCYTDFGQRSFSVLAPKAWNELLDWLRNRQTVDSFEAALETFLFTS